MRIVFSSSASDFEKSWLAQRDPYRLLWLHLARTRARQEDEVEFRKNSAALTPWPGPVVAFFLGNSTPEQVNAAVASGDAKARRENGCGARFFIAERLLLEGRPDEAKPLLQEARETCPANLIAYTAAGVELQRLGK